MSLLDPMGGPRDFPGKSTRVDCHTLLQVIFPTQGSNPGLPHWRQMPYHLSYQGSPLYLVIPLPVYFPGSAALLSVGKAGLNEPHICLPWSLVIMVDGKHQTDMVWGVRDQGIFSNHHCLDTASRMVVVFFPDYSPGWGLFLISSPTELYSLYFPLLLKL